MKYLYIVGTILFTVYGQIILKWRIGNYGALPDQLIDKIYFFLRLFADGFILSGFIAAFMASIFWMATITKFDISYAYPFMSLSFILVLVLSTFYFHEPITWQKVIGMVFITIGIFITSRSI
ncbi:MAG: EamA family transporter [Chlorobiaceae bacterium]